MSAIKADITKGRLLGEFDTVVEQTEQLLKSVASAGGEHAGAMRASVEQTFASASDRLARMRKDALAQAGTAADATDEYVQANPWRALGIVAVAAGITGLVAGMLLGRR